MSRTVEEHLAEVKTLVDHRPHHTLSVSVAGAQRARLAADVIARHDMPAFDNSQMDGYALPEVTAQTLQVGPTIAAGTDPDSLYPEGLQGLAAPIMTGAKVPVDTKAIVPVEHCSPEQFVSERHTIQVPNVSQGQFVRGRGSDIRAGETIARSGSEVTAALVGAAISQGIAEVEVERRARILIITGGAEVAAHGDALGRAQIVDSNGPMLEVLAARHEIDVVGRLLTNDDEEQLLTDVAAAVATLRPDAIVTSGGISHGKFEVIRQVFTNGWYGHVAQQPGGPQGLSRFRGVPVISLPGNPISTIVSFVLYVAPVLGHAQQPVRVPLAHTVTGLSNKDQFLRGVIRDGKAAPLGGTSSHLLTQAANATCLIRIPAGQTIAQDDLVTVYPF